GTIGDHGAMGIDAVSTWFRRSRPVSEVPFTEMAGLVPRTLQQSGNRGGAWIKPVGHTPALIDLRVVVAIRKMPMHSVSRRILAGHESGPAGRANRRVHVELCKQRTLPRQPVQVRGLHHGMAIAVEVAPSEIVCEHEDDIGRASGGRARGSPQKQPRGGADCVPQKLSPAEARHGGTPHSISSTTPQSRRNLGSATFVSRLLAVTIPAAVQVTAPECRMRRRYLPFGRRRAISPRRASPNPSALARRSATYTTYLFPSVRRDAHAADCGGADTTSS